MGVPVVPCCPAALAIFVGLFANILLNMALIPEMGLDGAVLATTIGNLINLLIVLGFNHYFGCKTDGGIWACVATPLLVQIDPVMGAACMIALLTIAWRSDWFFSAQEKSEILESSEAAINKCMKALKRR